MISIILPCDIFEARLTDADYSFPMLKICEIGKGNIVNPFVWVFVMLFVLDALRECLLATSVLSLW